MQTERKNYFTVQMENELKRPFNFDFHVVNELLLWQIPLLFEDPGKWKLTSSLLARYKGRSI